MRWLLVLSLFLTGCPDPPCGEGTVEYEEECVAVCGEGTVLSGGECVPDNCGAGTVFVDSECVAAELQYVWMPVPEGEEARFGQTFHGYFSHQGRSRFAVDLPMDRGTTVTAARGGRVQLMREDSDTGCGTSDCANDANYVVIDHGDGTFGNYLHLDTDGALVDVGDVVCAGQPIALSGNTGWSTGPHLHFTVENSWGLSLPLRFWELVEHSDGIPASQLTVESQNVEALECETTPWSECPSDLWMHLGVELDPGVPCSVAEFNRTYPVSGRLTSSEMAMLGSRRPDPTTGENEWSYQCVETDADGRFEADMSFPSSVFNDTTYLAFVAADNDCDSVGGFAYSTLVTLVDDAE